MLYEWNIRNNKTDVKKKKGKRKKKKKKEKKKKKKRKKRNKKVNAASIYRASDKPGYM